MHFLATNKRLTIFYPKCTVQTGQEAATCHLLYVGTDMAYSFSLLEDNKLSLALETL